MSIPFFLFPTFLLLILLNVYSLFSLSIMFLLFFLPPVSSDNISCESNANVHDYESSSLDHSFPSSPLHSLPTFSSLSYRSLFPIVLSLLFYILTIPDGGKHSMEREKMRWLIHVSNCFLPVVHSKPAFSPRWMMLDNYCKGAFLRSSSRRFFFFLLILFMFPSSFPFPEPCRFSMFVWDSITGVPWRIALQ